ncbi:hypothetical protein ACK3SF_02415 [Candidatus Nanosalina sp. VS9-1]|uniref:hypothetical protein n=1 Tax=Candidatus Nanosalina sp. VS9-1 TaxID=3388566 RepID=UPI0039DFBC26
MTKQEKGDLKRIENNLTENLKYIERKKDNGYQDIFLKSKLDSPRGDYGHVEISKSSEGEIEFDELHVDRYEGENKSKEVISDFTVAIVPDGCQLTVEDSAGSIIDSIAEIPKQKDVEKIILKDNAVASKGGDLAVFFPK